MGSALEAVMKGDGFEQVTGLHKEAVNPVLRQLRRYNVPHTSRAYRARGARGGWMHELRAPAWVLVLVSACRRAAPEHTDTAQELGNCLALLTHPKAFPGFAALDTAYRLGGTEALVTIAKQAPGGPGSMGYTLGFVYDLDWDELTTTVEQEL